MDKEALELRIEMLLKEQEEIRALVAENRDAYLLHLFDNLENLCYLYIDIKDVGNAQNILTELRVLVAEMNANSPEP
jgi:hypothetical protein